MNAHVRHRRASRPGRIGTGRRRAAHGRGDAPSRSRRRRRPPDRPRDARPHAAGDHRRRRRRPAAHLRGRLDHRDRERRDLQPPRPARRAGGGGPHLRHPLRLRGGGARLRGARRGLRAPDERDLRLRPLGRPARPAGLRARPVRREAALLALGRPPPGGGLRGARAAGGGAGRAARGPGGARPLPRLPLRARAAHALRGDLQAAGGHRAHGRARVGAHRDELPRGARGAADRPRGRGARRASWPSASPTPSSAR